VRETGEHIEVGAFQFIGLAVFEKQNRDCVLLLCEGFEDFFVGGEPRFCFLHGLDAEFLKEHGGKLLGGIQVKALPAFGVDVFFKPQEAKGYARRSRSKPRTVNGYPGKLHRNKHGHKGKLNFLQDYVECRLVEDRPDVLCEGKADLGVFGGVGEDILQGRVGEGALFIGDDFVVAYGAAL
jgi:hypothetical protein